MGKKKERQCTVFNAYSHFWQRLNAACWLRGMLMIRFVPGMLPAAKKQQQPHYSVELIIHAYALRRIIYPGRQAV